MQESTINSTFLYDPSTKILPYSLSTCIEGRIISSDESDNESKKPLNSGKIISSDESDKESKEPSNTESTENESKSEDNEECTSSQITEIDLVSEHTPDINDSSSYATSPFPNDFEGKGGLIMQKYFGQNVNKGE